MLFFFPRGVLDEILNLTESVSEGLSSYFCVINFFPLFKWNFFAQTLLTCGHCGNARAAY